MEKEKTAFLDYFTPVLNNRFGKGLTALFEKNTEGITKDFLSEAIGIPLDDLTAFERGVKVPPAMTIIAMMNLFRENPIPHLKNAMDSRKCSLILR